MTTPRRPNLLIAGVGKAGTTSLFWYLSQHPDVCASSVKEPQYFRLPDDDPDADLPPLEDYLRHFAHCGDQRYVMEASPQYFKGGARTISAIRRTLGQPRIVLMFRDPIDKMWSEFRFRKSHLTLPEAMTFDGYASECERVWREGLPRTPESAPYWTLAGGFYADNVGPWLDAFGDDLRVSFFEDMAADAPRFVADVCRWLGIDDAVVTTFDFSVENRSVGVRSRSLQRVALAANSERLLRRHRALKVRLRTLYYALNRRPTPEAMPSGTRSRLAEIFAEPNARLGAELARRGYGRFPAWVGSAPRARPDPGGALTP